MRRIGTTDDGSVLLEATAAELLEVDTAIVSLMRFRDACAATAPAELRASAAVARALHPEPEKILHRRGGKSAEQKTADRTKTCTVCGQVKPAGDFYDKHGACKPCVLAKQKAAKATKVHTATNQQASPANSDPKRFADTLMKTCASCKTEKYLHAFDKLQRSCRDCMALKTSPILKSASAKNAPADKPAKSRLDLIRQADRRSRMAAAPREHDPDLDRPVEGGRVLPVGGEV